MTPATGRRLYHIAAVGITTLTSGYVAYRYLNGVIPGDEVFRLCDVVTTILAISWLVRIQQYPPLKDQVLTTACWSGSHFPCLRRTTCIRPIDGGGS